MGEGHGLEPLDVDRLFRISRDATGWDVGLSGGYKGFRPSCIGDWVVPGRVELPTSTLSV